MNNVYESVYCSSSLSLTSLVLLVLLFHSDSSVVDESLFPFTFSLFGLLGV